MKFNDVQKYIEKDSAASIDINAEMLQCDQNVFSPLLSQ